MQDNQTRVSETEYGESYYDNYFGGRYERSEHWLTFFGGIADRIVSSLKPATTLDVGCAWGFLVESLTKRGVDATGFDFSAYAIDQVDASVKDRCSVGSATEPIDGRYDLVTCIEVIEHMTPLDGQLSIANMCAVTDTILLSSSPTDYIEPTHINVQPPAYWAALFAEHGFIHDLDYDATYLTSWSMLFRRADPSTPDLIRDYERSLWRSRVEADDLRNETKRLWSELTADSVAPTAGLSPATQQMVDSLTQELWAARDAAEGALAARGSALGQLAVRQQELEALRAEQVSLEAAIHGTFEELREAKAELEAIKSSRSWQLAQAGSMAAKVKRRVQR